MNRVHTVFLSLLLLLTAMVACARAGLKIRAKGYEIPDLYGPWSNCKRATPL